MVVQPHSSPKVLRFQLGSTVVPLLAYFHPDAIMCRLSLGFLSVSKPQLSLSRRSWVLGIALNKTSASGKKENSQ